MPSASSPLPVVRFLDQEAVLSCCRQLAESFLAAHPQVLEVGAFDPLAQGRAGPRSDVDLYLGVGELAPQVLWQKKQPRWPLPCPPPPARLS